MKKTGNQKISHMADRDVRERNGLLAKVHIAKKELCLEDPVYRFILQDEFGVDSAKKLNNKELEALLRRFMSKGWQPMKTHGASRDGHAQAEALLERVGQIVLHSDMTPARVRGLTRKICGVEDAGWCRDVEALKRLLAALHKIVKRADTQARAYGDSAPSGGNNA